MGLKQYELTDHLGNVRALVTDEKLSTLINGTPDVASFTPQLTAYYNYYPFGMLQPGRYGPGNGTFSPTGYRFGFNGKEKDNNGELGLTNYDYGFRIYNPAIGKFLSVDPLTKTYPMLTPYQFASNTPIQAIDLDGLEAKYVIGMQKSGRTLIQLTIDLKVKNSSSHSMAEVEQTLVAAKNNIEAAYSAMDAKNNMQYEVTVNFDTTSPIDASKDFFIEVNDVISDAKGKPEPGVLGETDVIGNTNTNRFQMLFTELAKASKTAAHEIGHGLGLRHPGPKSPAGPGGNVDPKNDLILQPNNLMRQSADTLGTDVQLDQLTRVTDTIDDNKGGTVDLTNRSGPREN